MMKIFLAMDSFPSFLVNIMKIVHVHIACSIYLYRLGPAKILEKDSGNPMKGTFTGFLHEKKNRIEKIAIPPLREPGFFRGMLL